MLRIEKIANDGETVSINYSQINTDSGELESYSVKSKRAPAPEFFEAWNGIKNELPDLMLVKGNECNLELRKITLKHGSVLSEQMEYKVQFIGSVYAEGGTDYQFTTGIREGYWEARDKNEEGIYVGDATELSEDITSKVNAVIECTLAYLNGASAQQSLLPELDAADGVEEEHSVVEEY